jgi:hypothetical protein
MIFADLPVKVFLHTITPTSYESEGAISEQKIKIITYLRAIILFTSSALALLED